MIFLLRKVPNNCQFVIEGPCVSENKQSISRIFLPENITTDEADMHKWCMYFVVVLPHSFRQTVWGMEEPKKQFTLLKKKKEDGCCYQN